MKTAQGKTMGQSSQKHLVRIANTADISKSTLGDAAFQIGLSDDIASVLDRMLNIEANDILVCETTCLTYAVHAASLENGPREVWLIPHLVKGRKPADEDLDGYVAALAEKQRQLLHVLENCSDKYKGITTSLPSRPFKLLIATQYSGVTVESALAWPEYNPFWVDMLNVDGATGVALYPPIEEQDDRCPSLRGGGLWDDFCQGDYSQVVELSNGRIALGLGRSTEALHMEDLSDADNPWVGDITELGFAVNDGCMVPSMIRVGVELLEETTLGEIAYRISRGTTLSEKDLDVKERLDARVVENPYPEGITLSDGRKLKPKGGRGGGSAGGEYTMADKWSYALKDDLYYIDGSCFNDGEIWPAVLAVMPKGQERYIVDERDGEVILISRNSKEPIVYRAIRPTLIGNSVFVIRLNSDINRDYLACWMRSSLAKSFMRDEGKMLSKKILESLPVPILDDGVEEQVVRYERSIDDKIFDLREEIGRLESSDRFSPLAAIKNDGRKRQ